MKESHVRSYLTPFGSPSGFDYVRKRTPLKMTREVERTMLTKNFTRSKVFWCYLFFKKGNKKSKKVTKYYAIVERTTDLRKYRKKSQKK